MLPTGPPTAPSACLRLQLRQVLLGLTNRRTPQRRHLSAGAHLQEETLHAERLTTTARPERNYVYRHIHPNGRIIGKPGRRQRQSSEQLATASLGKPLEVIVLRDMIEKPAYQLPTRADQADLALKDEETPDTVGLASEARQDVRSEEDEIMASIEDLRPHNLVLDKKSWQQLEKQLLERYNLRQLTKYLVSTLAPIARQDTTVATGGIAGDGIHFTSWQAGRIPLEQRVGRISLEKSGLAKSKAKVASKILQFAWNLTTETKAQKVGDLEMYVQRWQMSLLLTTKRNGKTSIEEFIDSPLLWRASNIRPHKEDNVVRISARKADAEEIVRRLRETLAKVSRDELDLTVFTPLLGQPGWGSSLDAIFTKEDLDYVTERTQTVFDREEDGKMALYSISGTAHARRLLLSLLDLPSPTCTHVMHAEEEGQSDLPRTDYLNILPDVRPVEFPLLEAHQRHRSTEWSRLTAPMTPSGKQPDVPTITMPLGESEDAPEERGLQWPRWWRTLGMQITSKLKSAEPAAHAENEVATGITDWDSDTSQLGWTVRFGVLLHPKEASTALVRTERLDGVRSRMPAMFHEQYMGLEPLLSNFVPVVSPINVSQDCFGSATPSGATEYRLRVHLTPSPYNEGGVDALWTQPRIVMNFDVPDGNRRSRVNHGEPRLTSVIATMNRQELNLAFPDQTADLSFAIDSTINLREEAWSSNGQLDKVVRNLRTALANEAGGLPAMAHVGIELPLDLQKSSAMQQGTDGPRVEIVPYYISHFEHVTSVDFVPPLDPARVARMDPGVRTLFGWWPDSLVLRITEVNGGAFGGRRTEAKLLFLSDTKDAGDAAVAKDSMEVEQSDQVRDPRRDLAQTAMTMLRLMTRANAGELPSTYERNTEQRGPSENRRTLYGDVTLRR